MRNKKPDAQYVAVTALLLVCASVQLHSQPVGLSAHASRMQQRIEALAQFGANPEGGVSRVAFSKADLEGREYIKSLMRDAGLAVRVDAAGNITGHTDGSDRSLPAIMFGSHIDSVPGGGNYDGDVGVIGAIEVAQVFYENGLITKHPLEVVCFADEEGGLTGSRAMTVGVTDTTLAVVSHSGLTIGEGIQRIGGDPENLKQALRAPGELLAFVELHIEQGAYLFEAGTDIGVVEGIVGIRWWDVTIDGFANHAGTTPMNRRQDAMVAAAELTLAINRVATSMEGRQVATVGRIRAEPGAPNVIPGRVVMSLEVRDLSASKMQTVFDAIVEEAAKIEHTRQTPINFGEIAVASPPAPTDTALRRIISSAAESLGLSYMRMPSGAGHDAQDMTHIAPTGMIFVPSRDGISHSPKEFTTPQDMANGANVLLQTILALDDGALDMFEF